MALDSYARALAGLQDQGRSLMDRLWSRGAEQARTSPVVSRRQTAERTLLALRLVEDGENRPFGRRMPRERAVERAAAVARRNLRRSDKVTAYPDEGLLVVLLRAERRDADAIGQRLCARLQRDSVPGWSGAGGAWEFRTAVLPVLDGATATGTLARPMAHPEPAGAPES